MSFDVIRQESHASFVFQLLGTTGMKLKGQMLFTLFDTPSASAASTPAQRQQLLGGGGSEEASAAAATCTQQEVAVFIGSPQVRTVRIYNGGEAPIGRYGKVKK